MPVVHIPPISLVAPIQRLLRSCRLKGQTVAFDSGLLGGTHACCSTRTLDRPGHGHRRMRGTRQLGDPSICSRPAGQQRYDQDR